MLNLFLLYSNATVGVVIPGLTGNLLIKPNGEALSSRA